MPNANEYDPEFTWLGIYRAKVIDAKDPDKQGKVKIWIPDLMPEIDDDFGIWARPANNVIGGANTLEETDGADQVYQGMWMVPSLGSYVYVFFEAGNPNTPRYIAGADFGQQNAPIENQQYDYEKKWTIFKSHQGRIIIVSDDTNDARVEITGKKRKIADGATQSGSPSSVYDIDGNQSTILIDERDGKEKILIKDHRGNYININTTNGKIDIEVPDGEINVKAAKTIKITAQQNIELTSSADVNVKAKNINLKAKEKINIESGGDANVKSLGNTNIESIKDANIKATGNANIEGAQANVKGSMSASIGGAIANVNASGVVAIDGSSLALQQGASQPPGSAGQAGSATEATEATPNGDRGGPSGQAGIDEIEPEDDKRGGTIQIPPLETKRYTQPPPNVSGSDR